MLDSSQRLSEKVKKHLTSEEIAMLDGWEIHNGLGPVAKFQAAAQLYSTRVLAKASEELRKSNVGIASAQKYSAEVLAKESKKLRNSNEKIAESNDRYTSAMTILTAGLFFVGLVQMFVQAMQVLGNSVPLFFLFAIAIVSLFSFSFRGLVTEILKKKYFVDYLVALFILIKLI